MSKVESLDTNKAFSEGITGASGKLYKFSSELSSERYFKSEEWLVDLHYSMKVEKFIDTLNACWLDMNESRMADAAMKVHEMREASFQIATRAETVMKICMLHFDTDDEDSAGFNETHLMEKVQDVSIYSYHSFFFLCLRLQTLEREHLSKIIQEYSKTMTDIVSAKDQLQKSEM